MGFSYQSSYTWILLFEISRSSFVKSCHVIYLWKRVGIIINNLQIFKGYFQLVEPLSHPLTYITPPDHRATFRNLQPCLPGETISLPLPLQRTSRYRAGDRHRPNRVPIYTLVEWSNVGWIFCSEKSQWSDEGSNSGPFGSKSNALTARPRSPQI